MRCPECLREPGPTTYTCTVPGCLKMRFCCPACILEHMGKHAAALESELSVAKSAIAGLMEQKALVGDMQIGVSLEHVGENDWRVRIPDPEHGFGCLPVDASATPLEALMAAGLVKP